MPRISFPSPLLRCSIAIVLATLFTACPASPYLAEGDFWFVERKGAVMPVLARGAMDSGTVIIFCHGGPGDSAQFTHKFSFFRNLEADYGLVYWDQRCSGVSQGNPDPDSFTLQDFTDDLDLVIESVEARYAPASIFLYGVSWGGTLVPAYLRDAGRQAKVKGMIIESGNHDADYWAEAATFFAQNPDPVLWGLEGYRKYAAYLGKAHPYSYSPSRAPGEFSGADADLIFNSPMSLAAFSNQGALIPRFNILGLDLSADMAAITAPALLVWGEYDNNSPPAMAADFASHLGTPSVDLSVNIIRNSGHNPFIDQPATYLPLFRSFVEAYK